MVASEEWFAGMRTESLEVRESLIPGAYRGVFARARIAKGETIETCPASVIPLGEVDFDRQQLLSFTWFELPDVPENFQVICWGFGSIYNHSFRPNAAASVSMEAPDGTPSGPTITFRALDDIAPGDEITHDYNYRDRAPAWYLDAKQLSEAG